MTKTIITNKLLENMKRILTVLTGALIMLLASCSQYKYETVKGDPLGTKIYTLDNGLKVYLYLKKSFNQQCVLMKIGCREAPYFRGV